MEKNKINKLNIINISLPLLFFIITLIRLFNKSSLQIDSVVYEFRMFDLFMWYEYIFVFIVFLFFAVINSLFVLNDLNRLNFNFEKRKHYEIGSLVTSVVTFIIFNNLLEKRISSANSIINGGFGNDELNQFIFILSSVFVFVLLFTLNGRSLKASGLIFLIIAFAFFVMNVVFLISYLDAIKEDSGLSMGLSIVFSMIFGFASCIFHSISLSMAIKSRREVKSRFNLVLIIINCLFVLFNVSIVLFELISNK